MATSELKEELSCAREQLNQSHAENCQLEQAIARIRGELESSTFENNNLRNELLSLRIRIAKAVQDLEGTSAGTASESPEVLQMED